MAVRNGDLAYLHVHALDEGATSGGPTVRFAVEVPTAGAYRLFLDFAHDGEVRTAAFTVDVHLGDATAESPSVDTTTEEGDHGHDG